MPSILKADTETRTLNLLITNQTHNRLCYISSYIFILHSNPIHNTKRATYHYMTLLLGTILTFPIFLCHLKIGIIKESSVVPLSKSRDYSISILPMKISICGHFTNQKEPCNRSYKALYKTCLLLANRAEE